MVSKQALSTSFALSGLWVYFTAVAWVWLAAVGLELRNWGLVNTKSLVVSIACGLAVAIGLPVGELHGWWRISIPQHYYVYVAALVVIAAVALGIEQLIRLALAHSKTSN